MINSEYMMNTAVQYNYAKRQILHLFYEIVCHQQLKTFLHHSHHYLLPHSTSVISVQRRRHNNYGSMVQEHSTHNIYNYICDWV